MDGHRRNVGFPSWLHTDTASMTGQMLSIGRSIIHLEIDPATAREFECKIKPCKISERTISLQRHSCEIVAQMYCELLVTVASPAVGLANNLG